MKVALVMALMLRLFYAVAGALFSLRLKLDPAMVRLNHFTDHLIPQSDRLRFALLGVWERFDTLFYIHIAQAGYDRPDSVVFPPLYPGLIWLLTFLTGNPLVSALIISTLASYLLFWAFYRLALSDLHPDAAARALIFYAVWPTSFIFFAGYPDSLTIALMLWAMVFARSDRWWLAGIAGFLAGLAKAVGMLVVVPLAILAWKKRSWRAAPALLSGTGYLAYMAWLYGTQRMLPGESYTRFWNSTPAPPWETIPYTIHNFLANYSILRVHVVIALVTMILALSKWIRGEYVAYVLAAVLFIFTKKSDPSQQQLARYLLILFPAPLCLGFWLKWGGIVAVAALASLVLNLLFFWGFMNWWLVA